eukprot:11196502-Lingulodinium_polyedra.AAC.1
MLLILLLRFSYYANTDDISVVFFLCALRRATITAGRPEISCPPLERVPRGDHVSWRRLKKATFGPRAAPNSRRG